MFTDGKKIWHTETNKSFFLGKISLGYHLLIAKNKDKLTFSSFFSFLYPAVDGQPLFLDLLYTDSDNIHQM